MSCNWLTNNSESMQSVREEMRLGEELGSSIFLLVCVIAALS